MHQVQWRI